MGSAFGWRRGATRCLTAETSPMKTDADLSCWRATTTRTFLLLDDLQRVVQFQVLMMNKDGEAKNFTLLADNDKDLIMFTITDLRLEKISKQVHMIIALKRKIQTEMLT